MLPAAVYFSLNRFDIVPALLTGLSLACLGRRCFLASGMVLGLATMTKVYPVVMAPLVLRYLLGPGNVRTLLAGVWRNGSLWAWSFGYFGTVVLCILPVLATADWEAFWAPYSIQLNRDPFLWTAYGYILPPQLGNNDLIGKVFRLGTQALILAALLCHPPADLAGLLRRCAVMVIVFVSLAVFYSPQWIVWFLPLLLPLTSRHPTLFWLVAALDLVTFWTWPLSLPIPHSVHVLTYLRFAILGGMLWVLVRGERKADGPPAPQSQERGTT
jgi:hypothetical protein